MLNNPSMISVQKYLTSLRVQYLRACVEGDTALAFNIRLIILAVKQEFGLLTFSK